MILSGSWRRIERSPRAKVRPFLFVDRNLGNAANLVFDRIFDGDDLVFFGPDLAHRGVERRGLAAARRPRNQHHPVRLGDVAPEFFQIVGIEAHHVEHQLVKLLAHRLFVEYAQHRVLAVNRGHDGHAEVDGAFGIAVFHPEAAVLRDAAFGDIQLAHHLDARNDGGVMLLADGRHGLGEHAVNAELDAHRIVASLDVNVTGPPLQRGKNRGIDQADNRADVALRGQAVDGDAVFAAGLVF